MRKALILPLLLAACGTGESAKNAATEVSEAPEARKAAVQTAELTGLYETDGPRPSQMCIIDRRSGMSRFGLVVWSANDHSCSGSGEAVQEGGVVRLSMAGDEECVIEAAIQGTTVALPLTLPDGCAYYCGARAQMAGITFEKTGGTAEDAMRAADLVGDPLCG